MVNPGHGHRRTQLIGITVIKSQIEETSYPHLTREEAYHLVSEHEDDFHAIEGLAQALSDMSSSDGMPREQGSGVYRVAMAIIRQYKILIELHNQLFQGLRPAAERAEPTDTKLVQPPLVQGG